MDLRDMQTGHKFLFDPGRLSLERFLNTKEDFLLSRTLVVGLAVLIPGAEESRSTVGGTVATTAAIDTP